MTAGARAPAAQHDAEQQPAYCGGFAASASIFTACFFTSFFVFVSDIFICISVAAFDIAMPAFIDAVMLAIASPAPANAAMITLQKSACCHTRIDENPASPLRLAARRFFAARRAASSGAARAAPSAAARRAAKRRPLRGRRVRLVQRRDDALRRQQAAIDLLHRVAIVVARRVRGGRAHALGRLAERAANRADPRGRVGRRERLLERADLARDPFQCFVHAASPVS
ncbi:putative lipoprotein [Burkholderia pseudomallei Pakistan 9]|nr:putative lipoprotein [Burkholderia pseudomallei Pakistan 9]